MDILAPQLPAPVLALLPVCPLLAVFGLLTLGIWLLPFAEEVALITAGYLYYSGQHSLAVVLGVTGSGVLLGDCLAFLCGRRWRQWHGEKGRLTWGSGRWSRIIDAVVPRYGVWAVFWARFLPGVRLATHVVAGLTGMPVRPYLQATLLAVAIYVPLMLLLAASYGAAIAAALEGMHQVSVVTWGLLSLGGVVVGLLHYRRVRGAVSSEGPLCGPPPLPLSGMETRDRA